MILRPWIFLLLLPAFLLGGCNTQQPRETAAAPPAAAPAPKQLDMLGQLSHRVMPERDLVRDPYRYDRTITMGRVPGVRLYTYDAEGAERPVGFALIDRGSPSSNPRGLRGKGAQREFLFQFPDRAREETALLVSDDVALSGRYSHDNMFRELYFFPRRQLPSLQKKGQHFEVRLPTGEPVIFDAATAEVVEGVLQAEPIDFNNDRYARKNPRITYQGKGLVITVAQRGEAPRRAVVWGQKKRAEVRYPSRYRESCFISPSLLWDQRPKRGDTDPRLTWRVQSDADIFALVEARCGWDLDALRGATAPISAGI